MGWGSLVSIGVLFYQFNFEALCAALTGFRFSSSLHHRPNDQAQRKVDPEQGYVRNSFAFLRFDVLLLFDTAALAFWWN